MATEKNEKSCAGCQSSCLPASGGCCGGSNPRIRRMVIMAVLVLGVAAFFMMRDFKEQDRSTTPAVSSRSAMPADAAFHVPATPYQLVLFLPTGGLVEGSAAESARDALLAVPNARQLSMRGANPAEFAQWQVSATPLFLFLRAGQEVARVEGDNISAATVLAAWQQAQLSAPAVEAPAGHREN